MKKLIYLLVLTFSIQSFAQNFAPIDKSPHDIVYYKIDKKSPPLIKIIYGRPALKGRNLNADLAPFGKVWRTGANESTEIKFYKDIKIGETQVKAGTYTLFTIPNQDKWAVILNSDLDLWGSYSYNQEKDVAQIEVPIKHTDTSIENFSIAFQSEQEKNNIILAWDKIRIEIPFTILN